MYNMTLPVYRLKNIILFLSLRSKQLMIAISQKGFYSYIVEKYEKSYIHITKNN